MIIILTGPTGAGKTDTSWALLDISRNMVFLDCDWFASLRPFSWNKESDIEMVYQAIFVMVDFYKKKGHENFVITLTAEMANAYEKMTTYLASRDTRMFAFRLHCDERELFRRISQRDRIESQKQQELKDAVAQQTFFDEKFPDDSVFYRIDSTGKTEHQIAQQIFMKIEKQNEKK